MRNTICTKVFILLHIIIVCANKNINSIGVPNNGVMMVYRLIKDKIFKIDIIFNIHIIFLINLN